MSSRPPYESQYSGLPKLVFPINPLFSSISYNLTPFDRNLATSEENLVLDNYSNIIIFLAVNCLNLVIFVYVLQYFPNYTYHVLSRKRFYGRGNNPYHRHEYLFEQCLCHLHFSQIYQDKKISFTLYPPHTAGYAEGT